MVDRMSWELQREDVDFCLEYQKSFFGGDDTRTEF